MKTITTIAASMMLMATTASATVVTNTYASGVSNVGPFWEGVEDTSVLPNMCEFTVNTPGHMDLDTAAPKQTWTTSDAADVTIRFRGVYNITVEASDAYANTTTQVGTGGNGALVEHDTAGIGTQLGHFNADVLYSGSTMNVSYDGTTATAIGNVASDAKSISWESPQSTNTTNSTTFYNYTAGVVDIDIAGTATPTVTAIYDANATYRVYHKVTCLQ